MPRTQHQVRLTSEERAALQGRLRRGAVPALTQTRAHPPPRRLRPARPPPHRCPDRRGGRLRPRTVARARAEWIDRGMACLDRRPSRNPPRPKLDCAAETRLIALTTGTPPAGHACWTLRLLTARAVELGIADRLSRETVRCTLNKTTRSRG